MVFTLCVIFAFVALFAVDCFKGFFIAKYAKQPETSAKKISNQGTTCSPHGTFATGI